MKTVHQSKSRTSAPDTPELFDRDFKKFQAFIFEQAGVTLPPSKKALVRGRLAKRLRLCGSRSFREYYDRILADEDERQWAIDLLTTNETYFFREPQHFHYLREILTKVPEGSDLRVWSAACSTGEEVYTLAMVLAETLGLDGWYLLGSDINRNVLEKARAGHYLMNRIEGISQELLKRYCLKGKGKQTGTFLVGRTLRERCEFKTVNLNATLPFKTRFDVIFLRNVMIYFSPETKQEVVQRIRQHLKPGGYLFIGHSESLNGMSDGFQLVRPSVYRMMV